MAWTAATVALAVVWVSSSQWLVGYTNRFIELRMAGGAITLDWSFAGLTRVSYPGAQAIWLSELGRAERNPAYRLELWIWSQVPQIERIPPAGWACCLPLWMILLPMLVPTTRAWLAETSLTLCQICNCNRAGLVAGSPCPECGTPAPPATPPA
jgi:hypothetical protein